MRTHAASPPTERDNVQKTDAQCAQAAIAGDADAFGVLVERLLPPLIGYVTGLLGSPRYAEEVAQEAVLVAWRDLKSLRRPERISGWIFGIAKNLARKQRRRPATVSLTHDVAAEDSEAELYDERNRALLQAVARLKEPFREVIVRKHFGRASTEEVAQQLGIAPGTVRSRLSRAYGRLRRMLGEPAAGDMAATRRRGGCIGNETG